MSEYETDTLAEELAGQAMAMAGEARAERLARHADVVADVNSFVWAFDREDDGEEGERWDRWVATLPDVERELRDASRAAREQAREQGRRVGVGHVLTEDHDAATCQSCSAHLLAMAAKRVRQGDSLYEALTHYVSVDAFAAHLGWKVVR